MDVISHGVDEGGAAAFIMTESHEFITNLLSYLSAKSLCSCARVCKSWHKVSQRLLKNRQQVSWSCSNDLEDSGRLCPAGDGTHPMASFETDLEECLTTMWSIPRQVILFTEFLTWNESGDRNGSRDKASRRCRRGIRDMVRSKLPKECSVLCLDTLGTVGTKRNLELLPESESRGGGVSCLLLPRMKDVRVHQFSLNGKGLKKKSPRALLAEICGGGVVPGDVKCVLLFGGTSPQHCHNAAEDLQGAFHQEYNRVPVIAGAFVRKIVTTESMSIGGIVLSGPNVRAASVLLHQSVDTVEQIKEQLSPLKSLGLESGSTVGFMFACIGRGTVHYREENVESEVFRECFPDTPLFGLFGNGEIGSQNLTLMEDYDAGTETDGLQDIVHGYTTAVVLVSFQRGSTLPP